VGGQNIALPAPGMYNFMCLVSDVRCICGETTVTDRNKNTKVIKTSLNLGSVCPLLVLYFLFASLKIKGLNVISRSVIPPLRFCNGMIFDRSPLGENQRT